MPDPALMARLARHRAYLERRARLGFPDAKAKLKALAVTEQRALNGEAAPPPIAQAPEITEREMRAACEQLAEGDRPDPRLSTVGRTERRGPLRRRFEFI
jgi:hypothetical protein